MKKHKYKKKIKNIGENKIIMEYGGTSYNRLYALAPAGRGYGFARSWLAPFPRKTSATIFTPCKCFAFAYSGAKNVALQPER
jgi:hypothetical protein